eukprot:CAMPEP_0194443058 /NCGR_PEP_ID=MMETSP0176-20130528/126486_1 /TAXON_ID=216777 /ORGANISM="Proboscia alata, Strain PI-D3" /LENGTH=791 /DNA_ID=CAMNT_0039269255 /DNA_START=93 /DNA_END=2467 /DNA_ORIENTATION=+
MRRSGSASLKPSKKIHDSLTRNSATSSYSLTRNSPTSSHSLTRNTHPSSHGTFSAPSQQNEDLVNNPKKGNNNFFQTRPAGSLMQPLSQSTSGGINLSASEHAIHTQKHTPSMMRSPSGSILRVKTADESRRLYSNSPHNSAGAMRLRQTQSSIHFGNTIPTEQNASSNATWGVQPMQNTIIRRISDPAALTSKEQHGEEQSGKEQYFREQPVKEKLVTEQSGKERKITNESSRVSSSGYKGDVDNNSKTNSSWDNIANERPPSPSEKITNESSRFSSSGYKGDVGNKSKTNNSWNNIANEHPPSLSEKITNESSRFSSSGYKGDVDNNSKTNNSWNNIANEHPPSLSEKITNESSRFSSSGYKGDVGNNSKTNSSRDSTAPVEEQHIKEEYGKGQPFKEQSVKKQHVKEKPVKEHYGKERHAREKYVHVQKQTPSMAPAPSGGISRVETTDKSRRLHPQNSAGSVQLRQPQSSILSGNTIPTEQHASSNATWGDQPLQNTTKRRISDPAALTSNEQHHEEQSGKEQPFNEHYSEEKHVREQHAHVPIHEPSMVRSGSILRVKTANESRRQHPHNSAGSMRHDVCIPITRQARCALGNRNLAYSLTIQNQENIIQVQMRPGGNQNSHRLPQESHMVTIDSMKSLGSRTSFQSAKSFDSKTSFGSSDRLTRTKGSLVNFNKITIVEYDRRIGDHPGARGPPISMGRYPKGETDMSLEHFENTMKKNRSRTELFLTPVQREAELRRAGYSRGEIFEATQGVKDIQRMRKQTAKHLKERDAKVSAAKKFGLDFH